ncbi:MAG: ferredoxin [Actinomycetales bacterium]
MSLQIGPARRLDEVVVDRVACAGRGVCAELAPNDFHLDEWGYPYESAVTTSKGDAHLLIRSCPARALYRRRDR